MSHIDDMFAVRDKYYTKEIRGEKIRVAKERREKILWKGRLAVGDFHSHYDCPKEIVAAKADVNKRRNRRLRTGTEYMLDLGNEIHDSYQKAARNTPGLKWIKPYNFPQAHIERLEQVWPEVPVYYEVIDPDTGVSRVVVSGIADDCIDYLESPCIVELKTENSDPVKFQHYFDKEHPKPEHKHQMLSYVWLAKRNLMFYPFTPKGGFLIYINTRMIAGDDDAEQERYSSLTSKDEEMFELAYAEADRQLIALDKMVDIECNYPFCKVHHGSGNSR